MFELGDAISFYCGGRGRGGHNTAYCKVVKLNRKSVVLEEVQGSYSVGMQWRCNREWLLENLTAKSMTLPRYNINFI